MLKRILRRVVGPARTELDDLGRTLKRLSDAQRDQSSEIVRRLEQLADLIGQRATGKDANEILHAMRATTALVARGLPASEGDDAQAVRLNEALDGIAKGSRPIIVGPWTGEVGFELLYWIPFVEWFRRRWRLDPERLVVVSRGGTAAWYGLERSRYVDLFSLMSPAEFRERTDRHEHKQREVSALERAIVGDVQARLGLADAALLHPRLMYRLFAPFWRDEAGFGLIDRFTVHRRIAAVDDPAAAGLPSDYVAVRFYFSDCFPDTTDNRAMAARAVETIAQYAHVVLLNPRLELDDHADADAVTTSRVSSIAEGLPPERNLAAQTAVIARARAFVGTYGGYSYLAPLCGVPAIGFYSERDFKLHHLATAQRIFAGLGPATVLAVNTGDANLVELAARGIATKSVAT
jgi:hypothetical protein